MSLVVPSFAGRNISDQKKEKGRIIGDAMRAAKIKAIGKKASRRLKIVTVSIVNAYESPIDMAVMSSGYFFRTISAAIAVITIRETATAMAGSNESER